MIELKHNQLKFSFPEVHPQAELTIEFQRTLRIPDDENTYPLPPGLGQFPVQHVDDFASNVPSSWLQRGGVMLPMYQSEAMWLNFDSRTINGHMAPYPFAIKIATGKQCAVSGQTWIDGLQADPQNYMVAPEQPWLDGYVVEKGMIRQVVAMPLGAGYTAEEQLTGKAEHGGLQISVVPMKREAFELRFPKQEWKGDECLRSYCLAGDTEISLCKAEMGLAPGGRMQQEIYDDSFDFGDWQQTASSRCFVHLCNSMVWQGITGSHPPNPAPTSRQYAKSGLPWFAYYDDNAKAVDGSAKLAKLKSVAEISNEKGDVALPENESVTPDNLVVYRKGLGREQVREGSF